MEDCGKFMILGKARTGTSFLRSLLQSHDQIVAYGEVLHLLSIYYNQGERQLTRVIQDPVGHLIDTVYRSWSSGVVTVGFKAVYEQLGYANIFLAARNNDGTDPYLKERREKYLRALKEIVDLPAARRKCEELLNYLVISTDIKILHVKRRNKLDTLLSEKLAARSNVWNSENGAYLLGPIEVSEVECSMFFEYVNEQESHFDDLFRKHDVLVVEYERLCEDTEYWSKRIQEFLGVEYRDVRSNLEKQNRRTTALAISNYPELKRRFSGTKWAGYFL